MSWCWRARAAAAALGRAFKARTARKLYWALTVGVPAPEQGAIKLALSKGGGAGRERAFVDPKQGKRAESLFKVLEKAGDEVAWVVLWPRTGGPTNCACTWPNWDVRSWATASTAASRPSSKAATWNASCTCMPANW